MRRSSLFRRRALAETRNAPLPATPAIALATSTPFSRPLFSSSFYFYAGFLGARALATRIWQAGSLAGLARPSTHGGIGMGMGQQPRNDSIYGFTAKYRQNCFEIQASNFTAFALEIPTTQAKQ